MHCYYRFNDYQDEMKNTYKTDSHNCKDMIFSRRVAPYSNEIKKLHYFRACLYLCISVTVFIKQSQLDDCC